MEEDLLTAALRESGRGYSADRVVADPELNRCFLAACQQRGLDLPAVELNLKLLNLRKRARLPRSARRTTFADQDEYSFAAELAVRCLERRHRTTLDRILCDPDRATKFDAVAENIAPGFSPLQYRWAALRLRKVSKLKPELLGRVVPTQVVGPIAVCSLDLMCIPDEQGLYMLTARDRVLYIGETQNLRSRVRKHLDHSDNRSLARHIWEYGKDDLLLECQVLPRDTRAGVRKAMELELIRSRRAEFNVQR